MADALGMEGGWRSGLEVLTGKLMQDLNINYCFEGDVLIWVPLPIEHKYHPDFRLLTPDGEPHLTREGRILIIETKGRFMPDDMAKQLALKLQHPEADIRLVFQGAHKWFRKAKRMSYAGWCEKHGIKYCDFKDLKAVLPLWMKE